MTVKLSGFKTFVSNNVVLTSGAGANVRATLEIGGVEEQVVVSSASEIIQTQSTTISSTINTNQILKLPLTTRSAMDFVTFLPGVQTPGGNRQSMINGLPQGMINITLDGVNIQDNTLRSTDGFFAIVSPRLDAIEEVTVTTAAQGSESAPGRGADQVRDALGHEHADRQRVPVLPARLAERQHLVQQPRRRREGRPQAGPVRRPRSAVRSSSRGCWTAATRRSSSSTTSSWSSRATSRGTTATFSTRTPRRASTGIRPPAAASRPSTCSQLAAANGQLAHARPDRKSAPDRHQERDRWRLACRRRQQYPALLVQRAGPVEAPLPDGPHRLQHHRQASLQQRVELQLVHGLPRHAEQPRCVLPRIPGRSRPEFGPLELEQLGAVDADAEHRQRGARRLQQLTGHVLQGIEHRHVRRARWPTRTGSS